MLFGGCISDSSGRLAKSVRRVFNIEDGPLSFCSDAIVLQHAGINADIFALNIQYRLWRFSLKDKVIITMRAVFVTRDRFERRLIF